MPSKPKDESTGPTIMLPSQLGQAIADYLIQQPYAQVHQMIEGLRNLQPVKDTNCVVCPADLANQIISYLGQTPVVLMIQSLQQLLHENT